jgi:hypothetical protein
VWNLSDFWPSGQSLFLHRLPQDASYILVDKAGTDPHGLATAFANLELCQKNHGNRKTLVSDKKRKGSLDT